MTAGLSPRDEMIMELADALEPFSWAAAQWPDDLPDDHYPNNTVSLGDLRHALTVHAKFSRQRPERSRQMDDDKIYECACGSVVFHLHKNGQAQCADCEGFFNDIDVKFPPGVPEAA